MNFTAFISGFLGGAVSVGIAILWMQIGWAVGQSGIFDKSPGKSSKKKKASLRNRGADMRSGTAYSEFGYSGIDYSETGYAELDSDETEELKRRYAADLKAFSDTMNYSAEQAYGAGAS